MARAGGKGGLNAGAAEFTPTLGGGYGGPPGNFEPSDPTAMSWMSGCGAFGMHEMMQAQAAAQAALSAQMMATSHLWQQQQMIAAARQHQLDLLHQQQEDSQDTIAQSPFQQQLMQQLLEKQASDLHEKYQQEHPPPAPVEAPQLEEEPEAPKADITIAVYFGTFDPIHENHLGLGKYAVEHGLADVVHFVVNGNNPMKQYAKPYITRRKLVEARLKAEGDSRLICPVLSEQELTKMDWVGREKIGRRLVKEAKDKNPDKTVEVVQIIGQDSFEEAVTRCSEPGSKRAVGIFASEGRFLVFPRLGRSASVEVPAALKGRARVVSQYCDPVALSSTLVREAALSGESTAGVLHPQLQHDIHRLYGHHPSSGSGAPAANSRATPKRFLLVLMGGPGSGKTSMGVALWPLGFRHISGGDVFRAANERVPHGSLDKKHTQEQLKRKTFAAVAHAAETLPPGPLSFDGFLPEDLKEFEEKVGPVSLLVELVCPQEVLMSRLNGRGARDSDVALSADRRVAKYFDKRDQSIRAEMLKSFDGGRGVVKQLDAVNAQGAVQKMLEDMIVKAALFQRLDLPTRSSNGKEARLLDQTYWSSILDELDSNPKTTYDLRPPHTMFARLGTGTKSLKNINNLIKAVLIDWGMSVVELALDEKKNDSRGWGRSSQEEPPPVVEVLDVASGRGGDQMKFSEAAKDRKLRLCYNGIDISKEQVQEACRRLRQSFQRDLDYYAPGMVRARLFVGDAIQKAPHVWCRDEQRLLPPLQVVSCQFAVHFSFGADADAKSFMNNALERLCGGGVVLVTTVDPDRLAILAEKALAAPDAGKLHIQNTHYRVAFPDAETARRIAKKEAAFGLRYHFALTADGIEGYEYVVPEDLLRAKLNEQGVDLVASVPFGSVLDSVGEGPAAEELGKELLRQIDAASSSGKGSGKRKGKKLQVPQSSTSTVDFGVYDRLGVKPSPDEAEVVRAYRAYIGIKRPDKGQNTKDIASSVEIVTKIFSDNEAWTADVLDKQPPLEL